MHGSRTTLDLHLFLVVSGLSTKDDATPVAGFSATLGLFRSKHDGLLCRALSNQFAATLSNEGSLGLLVALDHRTLFNGQFGAVSDINPTLQQVGAFLQCLFSCKHKFLVTIAYLTAFGVFTAIRFREQQMVAGPDSTIGGPNVVLL